MKFIHKYNYLSIPGGVVRLSLTNQCNMDCFYCHNEGQNKTNNQYLSFQDFKFITQLTKKFGLIGFSLTGGEPLLNPDFSKILLYINKLCLKKIDVCTNGVLIEKFLKVFSQIKGLDITIGLDRADPNKISKQSSDGVSFKQIDRNIQFLKKAKIEVSINSVLSKNNLKEIEQVIEYARDNQIKMRVIEEDTFMSLTKKLITDRFRDSIQKIINKYKLTLLGYSHPGKGYFAKHSNGTKIYFYNAKCHNQDCLNCVRCHLRINAKGEVIPCYANPSLTIPLLENKVEAENNFLKSLSMLGLSHKKINQQFILNKSL